MAVGFAFTFILISAAEFYCCLFTYKLFQYSGAMVLCLQKCLNCL